MGHVMLSELLQQQPAFVQWDNEASVADLQGVAAPVSLRQLLGGAGEPIVRGGITFYPCSPSLLLIDDLLEVLTGLSSDTKRFARLARALTYILQIQDEDFDHPVRRQATHEEVGNAFTMHDIGLVNALLLEYAGISQGESAEGN